MAQRGGILIDPTGVAALIVSGILDTSGVYQPGQISTATPPPPPLNLADGLLLQAGNGTYPPSIRVGTLGLAFLTQAQLLDATLPPLATLSPTGDLVIGGATGGANSSQSGNRLTTAIVSDGATAKTILSLSIPNVAQSCILNLFVRVGITTAGHKYDSTRVAQYTLVLTRVPGAATVATLSGPANAQIATSAGGQTLTFALALTAVSGGNAATQTLNLQATVTGSVTGTADAQVLFETANASATGVVVS